MADALERLACERLNDVDAVAEAVSRPTDSGWRLVAVDRPAREPVGAVLFLRARASSASSTHVFCERRDGPYRPLETHGDLWPVDACEDRGGAGFVHTSSVLVVQRPQLCLMGLAGVAGEDVDDLVVSWHGSRRRVDITPGIGCFVMAVVVPPAHRPEFELTALSGGAPTDTLSYRLPDSAWRQER